ncbi:NAD-dependent epimerase/dehydratase family protein [Demequina mangrovi]|uniref:Nucleoside-diphosphate-sugar epimerase n=1 Tax=Demequina mangrovi TaxID=1043493 RepID=A0A1H6VY04_9MICO|nr:NAD-dependent epimerase/dehydratase family protein [Demequina mangrovi]SEJ08596.1 Nucleoside-diphosphate-sugar epimerase [Demequina mangrovi]
MPALLILGGTAWLGRETAAQAVASGWDVTCLARGESGVIAPGATLVRADRDRPDAYDAVKGRDWDAVVEVSWQPRHVREAAEALEGRVLHWTYVSSVAAYQPTCEVIAEDAPLREPVDPDARVDGAQYDAAKVRCELDTLESHPEALLLRAGVIIGPGDPTERFAYWPRRAAQAGTGPMLVPGPPAHPVQLIDVRDLVAWTLDAIEAGLSGPVNVVGDQRPGAYAVELAREVAGAVGPQVDVDPTWLLAHGVTPWKGPGSLPLWVPDDGGPARIGYHSDERFLATGGRRRSLMESIRDILAEERALGIDRDVEGGLSRDRELELLAAWEAERG